ncbi:hypothetical protein CEXT_55581 [Caerostris extrusa]|uniref:Uncharacterized protein n=1 Tax=Caerostris extrusa TaxID=172846 RepID=A0AAV4NAL2_CAEEX|nr:hypothetical protein CEXT_55581 [Caerostris extrusa]
MSFDHLIISQIHLRIGWTSLRPASLVTSKLGNLIQGSPRRLGLHLYPCYLILGFQMFNNESTFALLGEQNLIKTSSLFLKAIVTMTAMHSPESFSI